MAPRSYKKRFNIWIDWTKILLIGLNNNNVYNKRLEYFRNEIINSGEIRYNTQYAYLAKILLTGNLWWTLSDSQKQFKIDSSDDTNMEKMYNYIEGRLSQRMMEYNSIFNDCKIEAVVVELFEVNINPDIKLSKSDLSKIENNLSPNEIKNVQLDLGVFGYQY